MLPEIPDPEFTDKERAEGKMWRHLREAGFSWKEIENEETNFVIPITSDCLGTTYTIIKGSKTLLRYYKLIAFW